MEKVAEKLATKWVIANYKLYHEGKNCDYPMWEKLSTEGKEGAGGEYTPQVGKQENY